eukprot:g72450.t1
MLGMRSGETRRLDMERRAIETVAAEAPISSIHVSLFFASSLTYLYKQHKRQYSSLNLCLYKRKSLSETQIEMSAKADDGAGAVHRKDEVMMKVIIPHHTLSWKQLGAGLMDDIRTRLIPYYISDFRDAFDLQCLSTITFIFFACLHLLSLSGSYAKSAAASAGPMGQGGNPSEEVGSDEEAARIEPERKARETFQYNDNLRDQFEAMAQAEEIRTETGPLDYDYTEKEVELCQENLQNHKACSPDKIKNEMLKGVMGMSKGFRIGVVEMLLGTSLFNLDFLAVYPWIGIWGGIIYALLSAQPLVLLGGTGPLLIFTQGVMKLCDQFNLDFLAVYPWIGIWMSIFTTIIVLTNASQLVKYITRFTEDTFAGLIAFIFLLGAFRSLHNLRLKFPLEKHPNIFLESVLLMFGTCALAIFLRRTHSSRYYDCYNCC